MRVLNSVLFTNGTLLDTSDMTLRAGAHVLVSDGRIAEVADRAIDADGADVFDCAGRVVMPGLIDAHVHVAAASVDLGALRTMPPSLIAASAGPTLRAMLMRGFTTVRDAGGADHGLVAAIESGLFEGPRLFISGRALSQTGGHGDFRPQVDVPGALMGEPCGCAHLYGGISRIADGVSEVRRAARDEIRLGARQIKIMASGGVASPTDPITFTQYAMDELRAIVEEAEAAETYVMAHAYTPRAIRRCIEAGVRSIEHGNLLDAETADLMAERGAFLVPTLITYQAIAEHGGALGFPEAGLRKLDTVLDAGTRSLEIAQRAGVKMAFGTDLIGDLRVHQSREFAIRSQVLPARDVLAAATITAAELMMQAGEIGEVRQGARADILVVDGNPLDDFGVLDADGSRLAAIMKDGVFAKRTGVER